MTRNLYPKPDHHQKLITVLPIGRPSHNTKFHWNLLISFAVILQTGRTDKMTEKQTWSHNLILFHTAGALRPVYRDATQLNSTSSWVQLSSVTSSGLKTWVELSCVGVAIDTSPTQLNSIRRRVELSWVGLCRYKRALSELSGRRSRKESHQGVAGWVDFALDEDLYNAGIPVYTITTDRWSVQLRVIAETEVSGGS